MDMMKRYLSQEDGNETSVVPGVQDTVSPVAAFSKVSSSEDDGSVMRNATLQGQD